MGDRSAFQRTGGNFFKARGELLVPSATPFQGIVFRRL